MSSPIEIDGRMFDPSTDEPTRCPFCSGTYQPVVERRAQSPDYAVTHSIPHCDQFSLAEASVFLYRARLERERLATTN
jgi:hypothetical protein